MEVSFFTPLKYSLIWTVKNFENSFVLEIQSRSLNLKKINLEDLTDKEFIEWLDKFIRTYHIALRAMVVNFSDKIDLTPNDYKSLLLPKRLSELTIEFNKFTKSIRDILFQISREDIKIFSDECIELIVRIQTRDYDLSELADKMIEPTVTESTVVQEI